MSDARVRELVRTLLLDMTPAAVLEHVALELGLEKLLTVKDLAERLRELRGSGVTISPAEPSRVFLAQFGMDYEGDEALGIFSTEAEAARACERMALSNRFLDGDQERLPQWTTRRVERHERHVSARSFRIYDNYTFSVLGFEVQV